jgi:glutathione S-transferase
VLVALNDKAGAHKADNISSVTNCADTRSSLATFSHMFTQSVVVFIVALFAQFNEQVEYFASNILQPAESNDAAKLKKNLFQFNTRLLLDTFLVDNKPTLADFFVLPTLKGFVVSRKIFRCNRSKIVGSFLTFLQLVLQSTWSPKEQAMYCNITRYYDHIQHLDEVDDGPKIALNQTPPPVSSVNSPV